MKNPPNKKCHSVIRLDPYLHKTVKALILIIETCNHCPKNGNPQ